VTTTQQEYDLVEPAAAAMIESMRAYGYTPSTAIADIVDNSISAGAGRVWLTFFWDGQSSFISILDDGAGMSEVELRQAMRPGSTNPLDDRDPSDLGRFGLGLKTASFSQCRRLTVSSKKESGGPSVRRWDLDYVTKKDKWHLLKAAENGSDKHLRTLDGVTRGTIVLWECLDRIVEDASVSDTMAHDRFLEMIETINRHIAMVFHRYLAGSKPKLRIYVNGNDDAHRIQPWDPFLELHPATISTPEEPIPCGKDVVRVQGFVLPHKDKLEEEEHRKAAGPAGWNAQQGFYVYRNERLLVPGNWLGLRRWTKEEHYKLARIRIDLPNSVDLDWQIDVKKSIAKPPAAIRERLRDLADHVRKDARSVYAHRGAYGNRKKREATIRAWLSATRGGRQTYRIDRKHPVVKGGLGVESGHRKRVEAMLRVLEETVPIQQIWLDTAEKPDNPARPFESVSEREILKIMIMTYRALRRTEGLSPKEARQKIASMEGFPDFPALVATLNDKKCEV
jgi:hypothetical protein